MIQFKYNL